jgi:hypothetical protein
MNNDDFRILFFGVWSGKGAVRDREESATSESHNHGT